MRHIYIAQKLALSLSNAVKDKDISKIVLYIKEISEITELKTKYKESHVFQLIFDKINVSKEMAKVIVQSYLMSTEFWTVITNKSPIFTLIELLGEEFHENIKKECYKK